jgi:hypothetical protein
MNIFLLITLFYHVAKIDYFYIDALCTGTGSKKNIEQVGVYPLRPGGSRTLVGRLVPVSVSRVMSFCYFSYVNINIIRDIKKSGCNYFQIIFVKQTGGALYNIDNKSYKYELQHQQTKLLQEIELCTEISNC